MMTIVKTEKPITFSPTLYAGDVSANYWLRQVTIRLRREICWIRHERGLKPDNNRVILPPFVDKVVETLDIARFWEEKNKFFQTDPTAQYLTEQLAVEPPAFESLPTRGSLTWVVQELRLSPVSTFTLALGLAVTFDNAIGSVIASCLNDPVRTYPNLALAQKLWDNPEQILNIADAGHPLIRYGLLHLNRQAIHNGTYLDWESPLIVPPLVARQLLFPDSPLPNSLKPVKSDSEEDIALPENAHLVAAQLRLEEKEHFRIVPIFGPEKSDHLETASTIARIAGEALVEFSGNSIQFENDGYRNSLATLCWLQGLSLFLNPDSFSTCKEDHNCSELTLPSLSSIPITIYVAVTELKQLARLPASRLISRIKVPPFSYQQRIGFWKKELGKKGKGLEATIVECARRFRYQRKTIKSICQALKSMRGSISEEEFINACRAELEVDLGDLAQPVNPRFKYSEMVLPSKQAKQFREIEKAMTSLTQVHYEWGTARVWNESGITVLFGGSPGTGKTMAAEILARQLKLPMYRIDLSQVVNKYIGETEKNLKRLFDAADVADLILFFDEADALFGKRSEVKDAHDRYANLEISYLLERMERFKGLAILATNRKKDLDEAFLRRLRYIVDFPMPGLEQRKRIWQQVIPEAVDQSNIDIDFLAEKFPLAGGYISSIVFNACLQNAQKSSRLGKQSKKQLSMETLIIAVKREYDKINRSISLEKFGTYAAFVQSMEK